MKSSEKRMIAILVAITIVVIVMAIIMNTSKTKEDKKTELEQTEKNISTEITLDSSNVYDFSIAKK